MAALTETASGGQLSFLAAAATRLEVRLVVLFPGWCGAVLWPWVPGAVLLSRLVFGFGGDMAALLVLVSVAVAWSCSTYCVLCVVEVEVDRVNELEHCRRRAGLLIYILMFAFT